MSWIRSPLWDGFWILSGLPIGIALVLLSPEMGMELLITIMILETAHVVSPMLLAWTQPNLRAIVSREWIKYIAAPMGIMAASFAAPIAWVAPIYWVWNIYHFGMQNFGVTSFYWRGRRALRKWLCLGVTAFGMAVLPLLHNQQIDMLCMGIFSFNHWLVDIGLSSRVSRWQWGFIVIVLAIGLVWLLLRNGPLSAKIVPQILVIRYGIGMVHFMYSGRIWRLSK